MNKSDAPALKYGFKFEDLFESVKLKELVDLFNGYFKEADSAAYERFAKYRDSKGEGYTEIETSRVLIEAARFQDSFLAEFFNLEKETALMKKKVDDDRAILKVKSDFIQRRVFKKYKEQDLASLDYN